MRRCSSKEQPQVDLQPSSEQDGGQDAAANLAATALRGDLLANDKEVSADGLHPHGDVNFTRLDAYVAKLQRDTFTLWPQSSWCTVQQQGDQYQAEIRLPPACAIRTPFLSNWCNSENEAKDRAAEKTLSVLRQRIDSSFQPTEISEKVHWPFTPPNDGTSEVLHTRDMSEWGSSVFVYALHVPGEPMERSYGFVGDLCLSSSFPGELHPAFNYYLKYEDRQLELEAEACSWKPDYVDIVRDFHCLATRRPGGAASVSSVPLAVSLLSPGRSDPESGCAFDLSAMQEVHLCDQDLDMVLWVLRMLERLRRLETLIFAFAPTVPAPNPMKLEAVFGEARASADAREALSVAGAGALQLMAALAAYAKNPWDTAEQLKARAGNAIKEERLALLLVQSRLPDICRRSVSSQREAATMLEALVGAHRLEADFFSVAKLWQWLTGTNEFAPALLHLGGSKSFLGRTESYTELWEGELQQLRQLITVPESALSPDEEERSGALLLVRYVNYDDAIYRRTSVCGEELRPDTQDARWERVVWDPNIGTYCSPSMKDSQGRCKPLPNKVTAWLRGRAFGALVRIKKCETNTPYYTDLRETLDGELHVLFKDYGVLKYLRPDDDDGTLGVEQSGKGDAKELRTLGYSEENKTLLSQSMVRCALPNKVVEWLHGLRSLAQIISGKKSSTVENAVTTEADGSATWISNQVRYTCWTEPTQYGGVYVAQVEDSQERQELSYSEVRKQWEVSVGKPWWKPGNEDKNIHKNWEAVPATAIAWISKYTHELGSIDTVAARLARAPWLHAPAAFLKYFPHMATLQLVDIEKALQHNFRNPQLLVEALTHGSVVQATTPSCERLAVLGEAATQSYIGAQLVQKAQFPTAATATKDPACQQAMAFAMPRELQIECVQKSHEPAAVCMDIESLRQRLLACCNHVSYAYTCVKLNLHKALHHNAEELKPAVKRFAKAVGRGAKWEELIARGAPKALGDVFLACVGAVVLDGGGNEADTLLDTHMQYCLGFKPRRPERVQHRKPEDVEMQEFLQFVKRAGTTIRKVSLAPPAPGQAGTTHYDQLLRAFAFTDICVCTVDGKPAGGVTPRAAELSFLSTDTFSESEASSLDTQVDKADQQVDHRYCSVCNMPLNGPHQWNDHRIGKKHLKNIRRAQQGSGNPAATTSSEKLKQQNNDKYTNMVGKQHLKNAHRAQQGSGNPDPGWQGLAFIGPLQ